MIHSKDIFGRCFLYGGHTQPVNAIPSYYKVVAIYGKVLPVNGLGIPDVRQM